MVNGKWWLVYQSLKTKIQNSSSLVIKGLGQRYENDVYSMKIFILYINAYEKAPTKDVTK